MVPGQRIIKIRKGRDLPQGDSKTLYPSVEQQEITKDHPLFSLMRSPRDVNKSRPGRSDQVLQHVCGNFQGIRQGPCLPSSCYHTAQGVVDPPSLRRRGHRHGGQQLGRQGYHDVSVNLLRRILQRGVPEVPYFRGSYPVAWTSKRKPYLVTDLETRF